MSLALTATHIEILDRAHSLPLAARWSVAFAVAVTTWDARYRSRKHLHRLNDDMLRDIGLTRASALREARKPFWQE